MNPKRFFMIMVAILILTVGGGGAAIYWADSILKVKAHTVSELLADRDIQSDKIDKLRNAKKSVQNAKSASDLINRLLPNQKSQDNLVANIIQTATREAGVPPDQISSISFNSSGTPTSLSGTTLSKEIKGIYVYPFILQLKDIPYTTMIKLFAAFESNQRIIQADQVTLTPDPINPGMLANVSLSLKTFVQP